MTPDHPKRVHFGPFWPETYAMNFPDRGALDRLIVTFVRPFLSQMQTVLRALGWAVGRLGISRMSGLATASRLYPQRARTPLRQAVSLLLGSSLIGVAVNLLIMADLGLSPYDVLVSGLSTVIPLSFGQIVWLVSAVLFAVAAALGQRPTRWGVGYVLANGVAIDLIAGLINEPTTLVGRGAFVLGAIGFVASGISLVVHSGTTGGAFELLMSAGELRGLTRSHVRTGLEFGVLALGLVLGGRAGIATVMIAASMGPLLNVTSQALADHSDGRRARQSMNPNVSAKDPSAPMAN